MRKEHRLMCIACLILIIVVVMPISSYGEGARFLGLSAGATPPEFLAALIDNGLDGKTNYRRDNNPSFPRSTYQIHNEYDDGMIFTDIPLMEILIQNEDKTPVWTFGGQDVYKIVATFYPGSVKGEDGILRYTDDWKLGGLLRVTLILKI